MLDLADMQALDIDVDRRTAWAETGLTAARVHDRRSGARPRDRVRRHGLGRHRRDHARRRRRLPRPQVRADHRRPARRRHRHRRRRAPPRRRRARPGPVLGDPRRRRQLRRRHAVQVPAARARHASSAACSSCPRRADVDRRLHRRGRGRARGAVDDRQRHARAADAVRAARSSTASSSIMALMCVRRRRRGRRARPRAVPGAGRRRSPTCCRPMPYPEIYPPEDEDYHPIAAARTMFVDAFDRADAETILEHLEASDAMMRVAQLRVLGGAMARVPPTRPRSRTGRAGSWSTSPPSTRGPEDGACTRPWVDGVRRGAAPGRRRRLRQLPRRRGRGAGPRRVPGRDLGPARGDQGRVRPDQPVPAQPEHPAGGGGILLNTVRRKTGPRSRSIARAMDHRSCWWAARSAREGRPSHWRRSLRRASPLSRTTAGAGATAATRRRTRSSARWRTSRRWSRRRAERLRLRSLLRRRPCARDGGATLGIRSSRCTSRRSSSTTRVRRCPMTTWSISPSWHRRIAGATPSSTSWSTGVGVPREAVAPMKELPYWPSLEGLAHTLPNDGQIMGENLSGKPAGRSLVVGHDPHVGDRWRREPAMVGECGAGAPRRASRGAATDDRGQTHDVDPALLAPVLGEFFAG